MCESRVQARLLPKANLPSSVISTSYPPSLTTAQCCPLVPAEESGRGAVKCSSVPPPISESGPRCGCFGRPFARASETIRAQARGCRRLPTGDFRSPRGFGVLEGDLGHSGHFSHCSSNHCSRPGHGWVARNCEASPRLSGDQAVAPGLMWSLIQGLRPAYSRDAGSLLP